MKPQGIPQTPTRNPLQWLRPLTAFRSAAALALLCLLVAVVGISLLRRPAQEAPTATELTPSRVPTERVAEVPAPAKVTPQHVAFLPMIAAPEVLNPYSATLRDARGLVQVQTADQSWVTSGSRRDISAGTRIRTGQLSSARLTFYDGSQVHLGPDTEISVQALDARATNAPRVIVLAQWRGETEHIVAVTDDPNSRYEVQTPTASGQARGTAFKVHVTPKLGARFSVDEGAVAVTGQNTTVTVVAGQLTTVNPDHAPDAPAFRITGQGQVTQVGSTWTIAGQDFQTHDNTLIVGNPQVGDWVFVEGHLATDGTRVADLITLLQRAPENRFTLTGQVDAIQENAWTVAGQSVTVNQDTQVQGAVETGDLVRVQGVILETGTLLAEQITLIQDEPGWPFSFTGIVQDMGAGTWTISGVTLTIDDETAIDPDIAAGDIVQVRGWILEEIWLARVIERVAAPEAEFEFTGQVESMDPWIVAGLPFETDEWTEIESDIALGDQVRVKGRILKDGTWLADEIERLDEDEATLRFVFVGTVHSTDPWVVSGIPLTVDEDTAIEGEVDVGDLVRVEVEILPDGTWHVTTITLIDDDQPGLGCLYITAVVVSFNADQLELLNWPILTLDDGVQVEGELGAGSVVMLLVCVDAEGVLSVIHIVVIYQPEPVIVTPPPSPPSQGEGDKVTICHKPHSKHPHTITISRSALQSHLDHGDTLGPCK